MSAAASPRFRTGGVKALAHITGGGLIDNIPRVLPEALAVELDADAWPLPPVMRWLAEAARLRRRRAGAHLQLRPRHGRDRRPCPSRRGERRRSRDAGETVYRVGRVVGARRRRRWSSATPSGRGRRERQAQARGADLRARQQPAGADRRLRRARLSRPRSPWSSPTSPAPTAWSARPKPASRRAVIDHKAFASRGDVRSGADGRRCATPAAASSASPASCAC